MTSDVGSDGMVLTTPNYEILRTVEPLENLRVVLERHGTGYSSAYMVFLGNRSPFGTEIVRFADRTRADAVFDRICEALEAFHRHCEALAAIARFSGK